MSELEKSVTRAEAQSVTRYEKPPLGVRPEWIVLEERGHSVADAIARYFAAGKSPLIEWTLELERIVRRLRELRGEV